MKKLLSVCLLVSSAQASVYHWVDADGAAHYSDQPRRGAKSIKVASPQITPRTYVPARQAMPRKTLAGYKTLEVIQPSPEATIRHAQGLVAVAVMLDPQLQPGDSIRILLDGQVVGEPQRSSQFSLAGLDRGEHRVAVRIVNKADNIIKESAAVVFFLHKPRANRGITHP